jgi:hypothetical protein
MLLVIVQFPPPPPTYTAFERLHQLHPAKADRAFADFIEWARTRRHFRTDFERQAHAAVQQKVTRFMTATPGAAQAAAVIDLAGEYEAWRQEMACATLIAEGVEIPSCEGK